MRSVFFITFIFSMHSFASESTGDISILGVNRFDEALIRIADSSDFAEFAEIFKRYVADLTTDHGRSMYSLMLSAQAQSKRVRIVGKNSCDVRADAESIQYIEILN